MRALRVEYARPPRWPVGMLWALVAFALGAAVWVGARDVRDWAGLSEVHQRTQALDTELQRARAAQSAQLASASAQPAFALDARRLMMLSTFDSAGVLRSVESAQVAGAKLTSLQLDVGERRVNLEVEVDTADTATAYLRALNAGSDRPAWTLSRIQAQGGAASAQITRLVP